MDLNALRQKTLAPALPPARKSGAAAFCFHAGAETVLLFASSLGSLKSAFHVENPAAGAREERLK